MSAAGIEIPAHLLGPFSSFEEMTAADTERAAFIAAHRAAQEHRGVSAAPSRAAPALNNLTASAPATFHASAPALRPAAPQTREQLLAAAQAHSEEHGCDLVVSLKACGIDGPRVADCTRAELQARRALLLARDNGITVEAACAELGIATRPRAATRAGFSFTRDQAAAVQTIKAKQVEHAREHAAKHAVSFIDAAKALGLAR